MYGPTPSLGPLPNISPQPKNQKPMDETAKTIKFLERILTQFFARQNPDSTQAKPRFMKNTSMPVKSTQMVSIATLMSAVLGPAGAAAAVSASSWADAAGARIAPVRNNKNTLASASRQSL